MGIGIDDHDSLLRFTSITLYNVSSPDSTDRTREQAAALLLKSWKCRRAADVSRRLEPATPISGENSSTLFIGQKSESDRPNDRFSHRRFLRYLCRSKVPEVRAARQA
jgi:hypothetical protein